MSTNNNHRFFNNRSCEFFPCHELSNVKLNKDNFNCLFCYCPLYLLGNECGGLFKNTSGIKDCTNCNLPHTPEYYDTIVKKLSEKISEGIDAYFK